MSNTAEEAIAKYKYSYYSPKHPLNATPFDGENSVLASLLHCAWLDHRSKGRPLIITREGETIFTEEELKRACALMTEKDHPNSNMREMSWQVIKEMGKQK